MKKELDYFNIGTALGGSQKWLTDPMMYFGGCAAVTACDLSIFFAKYKGMPELYPGDPNNVSKKDYVNFTKVMKPYIAPRKQGVDTLGIYTEGFSAYLRDAGNRSLAMEEIDGNLPYETAAQALRQSIDAGFPVSCLNLKNQHKALEEYEWHWFLLAGYMDDFGELLVKAITYGAWEYLSLRELWDTGYEKRGGLVTFKLK